MKKFLVFLFLMAVVSITASARKSYITLYNYYSTGSAPYYNDDCIYLTGDVPDDIEGFEYDTRAHYWKNTKIDDNRVYSTGEILNVLSEYGYEVESMTDNGKTGGVEFLLSKEITSGQTISKGDVNTDGEVNIADVNEVISLILGYVREHPEMLERYGEK